MEPEKWLQAKEIFDAALRQKPEQRQKFLNRACDGNDSLRGEVQSLLSSYEGAESFLETPVAAIVNNKLAGGQNLGHYEIIEQIGAGGMGEVFLARDKKLHRKVAVKILNEEFSRDESNLIRFTREAESVSSLNHPHILVIYEIGAEDDAHYIVSEFIEGKTLREIIGKSPMKLAEVLDISIQITGALSAAHAAHIVHRDIKPENIMVRPDGYVKILDFGLAKLVERQKSLVGLEDETARQNNTAKGSILGTINYMSPEQSKGEPVDERTDIFSFGVLVYEMIAGRTPFAGDSISETFSNLINKEPQPLSRFAEGVPDELQRIVSKTLRKNKDSRYQTMKGLLADLKELKENLSFEEKLERSGVPLKSIAETETANIAERPAVKHAGQFRRGIPARHGIIYAAVLTTLTLVALAYVWHWRQTAVAPQMEIKSLAVLPLKSLDAGENYLGLGIADAVIRKINQTGELTVRPISAVRHYLNEDTDALTAARQLNADAVLEGNVQRADDRLRVSVNLLRTADGTSLWNDSFDMRSTDIFTIQDTVAQQVASRLQLKLDPSQQARFTKRYTSNPIAYEFYVKGVYSFDQRGFGDKAKPQMEATIELFKKAIEADPNYALAHAQLALTYAWTAQFVEPTETVWNERAKEEINRAQALDPQLAETHIARHYILRSAYEGWQIEAAIRELLLAQQLNPSAGLDQLGILYLHIGLEDLYEREIQRALEVDPTSEYVKRAIVNSYENIHKYNECLAAARKYLNDEARIPCLLGTGRLDEAQPQIEQALLKEPDNPGAHQLKAMLLALKGDSRAAEAEMPFVISKLVVKDFGYHHNTYDIACVYALAGKSDEAVKWLRETAKTGFPCYPLFERDPYLNHVRQAPEFVQFMTEMKAQNERYRREFK